MSERRKKWVGQPMKRLEDPRLLTGRGQYVDDLPLPNVRHLAILRSPHAHARIKRVDASRALAAPGVLGAITPEDVLRMTRPFGLGVAAPLKYYCTATDKARFVGEPVAAIVASNRYLAEDALDLIEVEYEVLPAVVSEVKALEASAPVLHEEVGSNVVNHRLLSYGDVDKAFAEADRVFSGSYYYPKYTSSPMEGFAVVAHHDPLSGVLTAWSNFHGPFIMHPVTARALKLQEHKLRFIVPQDIGGGFGNKVSIYPYIVLVAIMAMKTGQTVKWIEDRREHLLASCSGADRTAHWDIAVTNDGTITGMKAKFIDNQGAYLRTPEPANLYRTTGNSSNGYRHRNLRLDCYAMTTNKSPTGPNRGYGCQQLYFGIERTIDKMARAMNLDPAELRLKNLVRPDEFPYTTPSGGIYDIGNYQAVLHKALDVSRYEELRRRQRQARAEGRLFGVGISTAVDPSVTNMAYITVAWTPEERAAAGYQSKSGSSETGQLKIDPLGKVHVLLNTVPEGQGHETAVAQIVADELTVPIEDVHVEGQMDTFTRVWSITTGTYSSRFASVGASAFAMAARKVKEKMFRIAAHVLEVSRDDLELEEGVVRVKGTPKRGLSVRDLAGLAHWSTDSLPKDMEPGLAATYLFNFPTAAVPDEFDRVNSSNTYSFITDVMAVEVDPETAEVKIVHYTSVHDCGVILNPNLVEGQIYGSALHGIGGAMYEELKYADDGQFLAATFMDYLCPTAVEAPTISIDHIVTPSPFTVLGSKGCGESSTMSAPVVLAAAVDDALHPLGIEINELPVTPNSLWHLMQAAKAEGAA
ncbi:MAG: xanthine dehydrogenase family protein molybdopterin-binding subunit [Candidatus Tectomicrobia bacterium]|nr:xanthine dehydrogenase family protein molybdopterin-binding subunit [Candidatus Tectomicrobia bacterium]